MSFTKDANQIWRTGAEATEASQKLLDNFEYLSTKTGTNSNLTATRDPTFTDNAAAGYTVSSFWFNTITPGVIWQLAGFSGANALWIQLPGTGSGGAAGFTFIQSTPAAVWTITHNLGRRPVVVTEDSANDVIIGNVHYVDNNTLTITFSGATSGRADLR